MGDSDHHQQLEVKRFGAMELLPGSVDAFSQLPFHRPYELLADRRRQSSHQNYVEPTGREKEKSVIRIFGTEINEKPQDSDLCVGVVKHGSILMPEISSGHGTEVEKGIRSSECRKFVCRYCSRVFPTCQALGGHQKAHKQERHRAQSRYQKELVATSVYSPVLHNNVNLPSPPGLLRSPDLDSLHGMRGQAYNNALANSGSNLDPCDIWNLNSNRHHRQGSESQLSLHRIEALEPQSPSSLHMPFFLGRTDLEEEVSSAGRLLFKQQQIKQRTRKVKRTADLCLDLQLSSSSRIDNGKSKAFPFRNEK